MRRLFFLVIILLPVDNHIDLFGQPRMEPQGTPIKVTQLAGTPNTGIRWSYTSVMSCLTESQRIIVRDGDAWKDLWERMWDPRCSAHGFSVEPDGTKVLKRAPLPEIDFNREMLIVAVMGEKPHSGYGIIVDQAFEHDDKLEITVRSVSVQCGGFLTVMTDPMDIVRISKSERPIVFREVQSTMDCKTGTLRDAPGDVLR